MRAFLRTATLKVGVVLLVFGFWVVLEGMRAENSARVISVHLNTIKENVREYFYGSDSTGLERLIVELQPDFDLPTAAAASIPTPTCTSQETSAAGLGIGDAVRLRIFEIAAGEAGASPVPGQRLAYERMDLSGIYNVSEDGTISLPLLGRLDVLGQPLYCIETKVAVAADAQNGTETRVSASFASRPRVLVYGAVRSPGRYDAIMGMTVKELLVIAGAMTTGGADTSAQGAFLKARREELERAIAGTAVKRVRLTSALEGKRDFPLENSAVVSARAILGEQRLEVEALALSSDRDVRNADAEKLEMEHENLHQLVTQKEQLIVTIEAQLHRLSERHQRLLTLLEKGVTTSPVVDQAEITRMAMERMLLEAKTQVIELRASQTSMSSQIELGRLRERHALASELLEASAAQDGLYGQLAVVEAQLNQSLNQSVEESFHVIIDRNSTRPTRRIEAAMTTPVFPGDVVTVTRTTPMTDGEVANDLGAAFDTASAEQGDRHE